MLKSIIITSVESEKEPEQIANYNYWVRRNVSTLTSAGLTPVQFEC